MRTFKKILVPVDGSELSNVAFEHSIWLARSVKGEVTLISIIEDDFHLSAPFEDTHISSVMRLVETERRNVAESLLKKYIKKGTKGGIKINSLLVKGNVANEIIKASKKFDIIIMGSLGQSTLKKLLLGSNAEKVARHAACPILLVK